MKNILASFKAKRVKIASYGLILSAIVIALTVFVNLVVSSLPTNLIHFSTAKEDYYNIGDTSKQVLNAVNEDITVYLIAEKGSEDPMIVEMLSRYEGLCSKITVKTIDPATNPMFVSTYTSETLAANSLIVVSARRSTVVPNSELYTVSYTEEEYYYAMMGYSVSGSTTFTAEMAITSAIDYVTRKSISTLYTLTGHGESALDTQYYAEYVSKENVQTATLNLIRSEEIPADCSAILIANPTGDISEDELEVLKDYMANGGSVILVTSYKFTAKTSPNLAALAEAAGLKALEGVAVEKDANMYYGYPYWLVPSIMSSSNSVTSYLDSTSINVIFETAHGIEKVEGTDANVTSILQTSSSAVMMKVEEGGLVDNEDYKSGSPISIASVAEKTVSDGKYGSASKLVWFSSPSILDINMANYVGTGNLSLFIAGVNYLCESTASISILGKSLDIGALVLTEAQSSLWMIVMTVIVPVAILGAGFVVWFRRRRR